MYDTHSIQHMKGISFSGDQNKPVIFYRVGMFIPVDHDDCKNFSKCWHTPRSLSRKDTYQKDQEYCWQMPDNVLMSKWYVTNRDVIGIFYSNVDNVQEDMG